MITPEDHFLKPCAKSSDYQSQGRVSGRNYVETNNKQQFTLKKDQHGTLLLCGLSNKPIKSSTLILRLATDDETFLEREFHVAPRFQASTYQGTINVSKLNQKLLLPLDLNYSYKCSDGQIQSQTLTFDGLKEAREVYIYQYKDNDDLQQVFRYRVNLLEEVKLPSTSAFGRKISFKCEPSLFMREDLFCDGNVLVLARQHRQICI